MSTVEVDKLDFLSTNPSTETKDGALRKAATTHWESTKKNMLYESHNNAFIFAN